MRMLMKVTVPVESGNKGIKEGTLPKLIQNLMEEAKPEAAYFTTENGARTALFVIDMKDSKQMPALGEPFFMGLNAQITFSPVMNADDLRSGLQSLK